MDESTEDYSPEALGVVVRRWRRRKGLSQEDLGRKVGYGSGAGVSVSRLEAGLIRVNDERLKRIARVLGGQFEELVGEARSATQAGEPEDSDAAADSEQRSAKPADDDKPMRLGERIERAERLIQERHDTVTTLGEGLNDHQLMAQNNFVLPFIEVAHAIEGAPFEEFPSEAELSGHEAADRAQRAATRIRLARAGVSQFVRGGAVGATTGGAVGAAAAFGTFSFAAAFGTASTGTAIAALTGVAASNATFAFLGGGALAAGGAGIAGGAAVLGAIVAAPVVLLSVGGGALWYRKKRKEAEDKVSQAEVQLDATQDRYDALIVMLEKAASVLRDIRLFATRAFTKWADTLPDHRPVAWDELTTAQRESYEAFITITACYLSVASLNPESLMDAHTSLEETVADNNAVLEAAASRLKELV